MTQNRVSIVTRTRDRTLTLKRAIESVLSQTTGDWTHIIVNDAGEREPLKRLIGPYSDRYAGRLILLHNDGQMGTTRSLNAGVAAAKGRQLVVHDDDDSWRPSFLERSLQELDRAKEKSATVRGVMCHTRVVKERLVRNEFRTTGSFSFNGWLDQVSILHVVADNPICPISFVFDRDVLGEIGSFDERFEAKEDWEFYLRFLERYDITVLPEHLANWHIRNRSAAYGNTVTTGIQTHRLAGAQIRNQYVRRDLATGRFGLGGLIADSESGFLKRALRYRLRRVLSEWRGKFSPPP